MNHVARLAVGVWSGGWIAQVARCHLQLLDEWRTQLRLGGRGTRCRADITWAGQIHWRGRPGARRHNHVADSTVRVGEQDHRRDRV
jgi:hypothetical protein